MKKDNVYCRFIERDGNLEFHLSHDKKDVIKGEALSKRIPLSSPGLNDFKWNCREDIKLYGMKEIDEQGRVIPPVAPEEALKVAILRHPKYISGDDDLTTKNGVIETAILVLDRIADDRQPVPNEKELLIWQPIETAPKDRRILGFDPHLKRPFVMIWNVPDQCFAADGTAFEDETPTHWMPLPPTP